MRRYETIFIIDPDLTEDDRNSTLERLKEIIQEQQGVFLQDDLWGIKKLAYDIKKKPRGYYARFDYCGLGPVVDELERFCKIDDRVMKFLTVQLDPEADVEKIQAEISTAAAAASETETVAESPADAEEEPAKASEKTATEPEGQEE
jgi:small subunit ribosomal protein S6